ncbi:MAG: THUMP domain-containing protein [Thermoprotei archaeon]
MGEVDIVYTVNPGIEDIAAGEVLAELGGSVEYEYMSGHVYQCVKSPRYERIYGLRSINRAFLLLYKSSIGRKIQDLVGFREDLYTHLRESNIEEYVSPLTSFAVDTERIGEHEFTSMDISRIVGSVIQGVVEAKTGRKPRVDLRKPSVIIHVFIKDTQVVLGVSLTGPYSMHRRGYRVYDHPAALKPTLAYAMLTLSGTRDGNAILDPMCGGGTIPIEARLFHEDVSVYCFDKNPKYIEMAKRNAMAAGVYELITFRVWDARRLHEAGTSDIDHIISNPPYGLRFGDPHVIRSLYRDFISSAVRVLSNSGRLTIITTEYTYVRRIAEKSGLRRIHERTVQHGGLYPHIIVFEKQ